MSERAEDDVRGEQRRAARQQLKQQQIQRGEGSTAMATAAERRSLANPEIILGQPWSNWVDSAKLYGGDGEFPGVPNCVRESEVERDSCQSCPPPPPFLVDCMQFLVEYEETLLVAAAQTGEQVQLFMSLCVGSSHFQALNRRKVSKTSGKIERPCACAEKVSVIFLFLYGQRCLLVLEVCAHTQILNILLAESKHKICTNPCNDNISGR